MRDLLLAPFGIVFMFGGPITYILLIVDTWQSNVGVLGKLAMSLTLDVILAAIWPITWIIWIITYATGGDSPLTSVLGI